MIDGPAPAIAQLDGQAEGSLGGTGRLGRGDVPIDRIESGLSAGFGPEPGSVLSVGTAAGVAG